MLFIWKAYFTEEWRFPVWNIFFRSRDVNVFLCYANYESDYTVNGATKMVKYWIKNITRNIGEAFFELGTGNVHHERNKVIPVALLPWQQFCRWTWLYQLPSTPSNLMKRVKTASEARLFWARLSVALKRIGKGDMWLP